MLPKHKGITNDELDIITFNLVNVNADPTEL